MNFSTVYERIAHRLRYLARNFAGYSGPFDENDLYQEMCMFLWNKYKDGVPETENESYVTKACEFYIRNYLRVNKDKQCMASLDVFIEEKGCTLKDLLPDSTKEDLAMRVDKDIIIQHILNNGFTKKEKDVFSLLIEGYTVREAGRKLGVSHVMVVKLKKSLISKWHKKENRLPRI